MGGFRHNHAHLTTALPMPGCKRRGLLVTYHNREKINLMKTAFSPAVLLACYVPVRHSMSQQHQHYKCTWLKCTWLVSRPGMARVSSSLEAHPGYTHAGLQHRLLTNPGAQICCTRNRFQNKVVDDVTLWMESIFPHGQFASAVLIEKGPQQYANNTKLVAYQKHLVHNL